MQDPVLVRLSKELKQGLGVWQEGKGPFCKKLSHSSEGQEVTRIAGSGPAHIKRHEEQESPCYSSSIIPTDSSETQEEQWFRSRGVKSATSSGLLWLIGQAYLDLRCEHKVYPKIPHQDA